MTRAYGANLDPGVVRVFLVRHGRTPWNSTKRIQGHIDIDLDELGHEQAKLVAEYLKDISMDNIVSSDLVRCRSTVAYIGTPSEFSENWRERFMGAVEGMYYPDAVAKYGTDFRNFGEKEDAFRERLEGEWMRVTKRALTAGHKNMVVCTHGGVLTALSNHLHSLGYKLAPGLKKESLRVPFNTSVTVIDVCSDGGVIVKFGSTDHLGGDYVVENQGLR